MSSSAANLPPFLGLALSRLLLTNYQAQLQVTREAVGEAGELHVQPCLISGTRDRTTLPMADIIWTINYRGLGQPHPDTQQTGGDNKLTTAPGAMVALFIGLDPAGAVASDWTSVFSGTGPLAESAI